MTNQPYKFWSKTELADHLHRLASKLNMGIEVKVFISYAITDSRWDVIKDYNGCSVVQDLHHPCLSCFVHDYLWLTGQGGKDADYLFYKLMLLEGASKNKAKRRWFAVRVAWLTYYKWKHFVKRNVNPYSDDFLRLLEKFKK